MQNLISNFEALSEEDLSLFAGQWIAVLNEEIVAHNNSFKEVYKYVKENYPRERPLIGKLPEANPVVLSIG
jgi:hypothetical protein